MLTIKRVLDEQNCLFCSKTKEVAVVSLDGQGEMQLCWADLKKMAKMRMRMNGTSHSITTGTQTSHSNGTASGESKTVSTTK